jgi:hypothetical protein
MLQRNFATIRKGRARYIEGRTTLTATGACTTTRTARGTARTCPTRATLTTRTLTARTLTACRCLRYRHTNGYSDTDRQNHYDSHCFHSILFLLKLRINHGSGLGLYYGMFQIGSC